MADEKITQENIEHKLKKEITELEEKKRDTKKQLRSETVEFIIMSVLSAVWFLFFSVVAVIGFNSLENQKWYVWLLFALGLIFSVPGNLGVLYFIFNIEECKAKWSKMRTGIVFALCLAGNIILVAAPLLQQDETRYLSLFGLFLLFFCCCFVMAALSYYKCSDLNKELRHLESDIKEKQDELELSELKGEDRAVRLFRKNQTTLDRYYDTNLRQQNYIFLAGIFAMGIGAVIIIITLLCKNNMQENAAVVLAGTGSGALISVIGAIITGMYTQTTKASIKLHGKLVHTQNIFFANMLVEKIKDNESLTNETLSGMAKELLSNRQESEEKVERE